MARAPLRIGVPDFVSPSYFPIIAAVELGLVKDEGVDAEVELLFPVTDAAHALRDGRLDLLGGAAHAPLYAFPDWEGAALVAALSENTYWFLVARTELGIARGDLNAMKGLRIGAAPGVGESLEQILRAAGIDLEASGIQIAPVPGAAADVSFGLMAAVALADGAIDAFWANGMASEVAVSRGTGAIVLDARRDEHPGSRFTFPALSTTRVLIDRDPEAVAAVVRALVRAQDALRADASLATRVGEKIFPAFEAGLIGALIERDSAYYAPSISPEAVVGIADFAVRAGLTSSAAAAGTYERAVAAEFSPLWAATTAGRR